MDNVVFIGAERFRILGRLAAGEACDVFYAVRNEPDLTELVVMKIARTRTHQRPIEEEWRTISNISQSDVQGSHYFRNLIPQPVTRGILFGSSFSDHQALVYRWRSGFIHTLADVMRVHPNGVSVQTAIWMWKRLLDLSGWIHRTGYVHGGLLPAHLLIHARDHGMAFLGMSRAVKIGTPLRYVSSGLESYYPEDIQREHGPMHPYHDIIMGSRCIFRVFSGYENGKMNFGTTPVPLFDLLTEASNSNSPYEDAWALKNRLDALSRELFGPPKYHKFTMPGWSADGTLIP